jgi:hypothetical protein
MKTLKWGLCSCCSTLQEEQNGANIFPATVEGLSHLKSVFWCFISPLCPHGAGTAS